MANRKLNLLFGITRHDINNQLTVLNGYLEILHEKIPDPRACEDFRKVSEVAGRIYAMIQFTREYEQIGVNAPVWQDCHTIVDDAANQSLLGKILVKNDIPPGIEVFADPLIIKVFYNLIDNSAQHGGPISIIRFSVNESGENNLLICEDDGKGILLKNKEKIFDKNFGNKTGQGLFLSREILEITGITIRENGEPGEGAHFEICVPENAWRVFTS